MTPTAASTKLHATNRIAAILAAVTVALAITVIVLAVMLTRQKQEMVLVPTLQGEATIITGTASNEYLQALTRDAAALFLNRHPNNSNYFRQNLLRMVDGTVFGEMEAQLLAERNSRIKTKTSTVFHPSEIYVSPEGDYSEIGGIVQTFVASQMVSEETKVFAARWRVQGLQVRLLDFSEIERSRARMRSFRQSEPGEDE